MTESNPRPLLFLKKQKKKSQSLDSAPWMITFLDTISLLLTFYVMLFSMTTLDQGVWQDVVDTFDSYFEDVSQAGGSGTPLDQAIPKVLRKKAINLDYLQRVLETQIKRKDLQNQIYIHKLDERIVLSLPADLTFFPGQADLRPEARDILITVGSMLRNVRNKVEINGHTDPIPVGGQSYPSNWELALERANRVRETLSTLGLSRGISILSFADGKYQDLADDLPQGEKFALSRRVDIVIYPYAF